jgi:hypothetical protein
LAAVLGVQGKFDAARGWPKPRGCQVSFRQSQIGDSAAMGIVSGLSQQNRSDLLDLFGCGFRYRLPLGGRRPSVQTFSVEGIHQSAGGHLFREGQTPQIGTGESSTCSDLEGLDFWARGLRSYWALQLYEQTGCPHGGT